jgi:hypothetical protein
MPAVSGAPDCRDPEPIARGIADRAGPTRTGATGAPEGKSEVAKEGQELAFSTVTARRFCDQHEISLQTATGRSLP